MSRRRTAMDAQSSRRFRSRIRVEASVRSTLRSPSLLTRSRRTWRILVRPKNTRPSDPCFICSLPWLARFVRLPTPDAMVWPASSSNACVRPSPDAWPAIIAAPRVSNTMLNRLCTRIGQRGLVDTYKFGAYRAHGRSVTTRRSSLGIWFRGWSPIDGAAFRGASKPPRAVKAPGVVAIGRDARH